MLPPKSPVTPGAQVTTAAFNGALLGPLYNFLDAVIKPTQADSGDLQLIDSNSGGLRIVAQRDENDSWISSVA